MTKNRPTHGTQRPPGTGAILVGLLIITIFFCVVPASGEVIIDYIMEDYVDTGKTGFTDKTNANAANYVLDLIYIKDISLVTDFHYLVVTVMSTDCGYNNANQLIENGRYENVYTVGDKSGLAIYYVERTATYTKLTFFFDDWDNSGMVGAQTIGINDFKFQKASENYYVSESTPLNIVAPARKASSTYAGSKYKSIITYVTGISWKNHLVVDELPPNPLGGYNIDLYRGIDGKTSSSTLDIYGADGTIFLTDTSLNNVLGKWYSEGSIAQINVTSPLGKIYKFPLGGESGGGPDDPNDPPPQPTLRIGSVTMTDNNGTTITGFEVTAVNHYTGQSYTVATETDVVVMTLPMDRSITIRNPQTGVYEDTVVGYYRFYGQSPGYKMLYEDGIQVSVMPEKYGSYQLCDILVTHEIGYLTGKHQFQIRSRSDNSILQTGTISAKSATTGEWYNSTVSGGIASLILPYDTSNTQSQYAGNYYVYATSPGYKDSDYGTQIVVMPHTVSEIHNILLTPIGGIPTPGNVTLRIQVFSETGPGIPNAEIFIAGVLGAGSDVWNTYTASSTGYLTVSVPGNSTYDIVASGTGYYDSARRVQVFAEDPALIEIKLYLSGAPTVEPTTQPTGWVTPKPTQTTPPIQEDNLIGISVKGLAKGFGIDYDTALLLFGLMIVFGAGGIVMNSAKGGAMEFIAGSIVGTFVAFALGLIPIWIFIIIAVVFGAYVLRVFVQGGQ